MNLAMVQAGLVWWYRHYADEQTPVDRTLYEAAETKAKAERRGLWADPKAIPPWDFRHQPAPVGDCPCDSGKVCRGPKGGLFWVKPEGVSCTIRKTEGSPDRCNPVDVSTPLMTPNQ